MQKQMRRMEERESVEHIQESKSQGGRKVRSHWIWGLYGQERVIEAVDPRLNGDFEEEQMKRALILGLACPHPDPQLRPSIIKSLQVLINPNEQLMLLPSSRPLAIYVGLPVVAPLNSQPTSSYSNVGHPGSASTISAYSGDASITASTLHHGR